MNIKNYSGNGGNVSVVSTLFSKATNLHSWPKVQGIVIQNATGPVTIDGGVARNKFESLNNGIDIVSSNVTMKNNKFKDILCSYSNCLNGTRASVRASSGANPTNLIVGGSSSDKCIFENCYSGIAAFNNVAMDVQYNEFNNTSYTSSAPSVGVTGVRSTNMTQTISNNDFKYFYYGRRFKFLMQHKNNIMLRYGKI